MSYRFVMLLTVGFLTAAATVAQSPEALSDGKPISADKWQGTGDLARTPTDAGSSLPVLEAADDISGSRVKEWVPTVATAIGEELLSAMESPSVAPSAGEESGELEGKIDLDRIHLERLYQAVQEGPPREQMNLSLEECVQRALASNQDVRVSMFEPLKIDGDLLAAKGEFDPVLSAGSSYTSGVQDVRDNAEAGGAVSSGMSSSSSGLGSGLSSLGGLGGGQFSSLLGGFSRLQNGPGQLAQPKLQYVDSTAQSYDIGLAGKLHWGTTYDLRANLTYNQQTMDYTDYDIHKVMHRWNHLTMWPMNAWMDFLDFTSDFRPFYPGPVPIPDLDHSREWTSSLTLSISQPLLRGRGKSVNTTRIRIAENSRLAANNQVEATVLKAVSDVVKAYWDLVGARETVKVREESLANAERLLDINEKRLSIGTAAALEVLQAKAGVAARQSELINARSQVKDAEDRLKQLLDMRDKDRISPVEIIPTDLPSAANIQADEAQSLERALKHRPELRMAEIERENAGLEKKRASNDMLPQLDLRGSVYQGGKNRGRDGALRDITERTNHSYTVGISGSVPIGNRLARGSYHRAQLTERQAEQRLQKTQQEVVLSVRLAVRAVETGKVLVESTKQTRALQEANVEAEEKRLRLGLVTSFEVLRVQEDLTMAQTQEVQAVVNLQKALVDLQTAEGVLLTNLNIDFEPPVREKPVSFLESLNG